MIGIFYPKEGDGHCVSIISGNGEKKSFGTRGSGPGQFNSPEGGAIDNGEFNCLYYIDREGNVCGADFYNHRIQVSTAANPRRTKTFNPYACTVPLILVAWLCSCYAVAMQLLIDK